MNNRINSLKFWAILPVLAMIFACGGGSSSSDGTVDSKRTGVNEVVVHESTDVDKINPIVSRSANASFVDRNIFQTFLDIDPITYEYNPILCAERPTIEETMVDVFGEQKDGLLITYIIRDEAVWDNGEPITGHDAAFSLKIIKNPKVDCANLRPYYDFVVDVKVNEENPKEFTLVCEGRYFMAEIWSSLTMYPIYNYDPENLMAQFSIADLSDPAKKEEMVNNTDIVKFAEQFNSEPYARDPSLVKGSGPYELQEWTTGQRIILKKKENWWGAPFVGTTVGFNNYPDKLVYEIVVDMTTAVTALKDEGLDVMRQIPSKDYVKLKENEDFLKYYNLSTPMQLSYSYVGLNTRIPELADKKVRQALSMAVDYETILSVILYDLAVRTVGPIHPSKNYYNNDIALYEYNLEAAASLLDEAGWTDADADGVREKEIDGEVLTLELEYMISQGSPTAESIALMYQKSLSQIGVGIEIVQKEWTVFLDITKAHDYDMYSGGWVAAPTLSDMKQIWHTTSYDGGSNYVGFGDEHTDDLIEKIRYELDETA
ncbi:MAG: ABC transporter substrate-binding protein, partial [Chitinophagales bacterium]